MTTQHSNPAPRRVKVKGHPGVYYREGRSGERTYEITYLDSDGRRRWKVVPGKLDDAEGALTEIKSKIHHGERVAPNRVTFEDFGKTWLARQADLRPATLDAYESALRIHLYPRFGRLLVASITEDHIADLIAAMRADGYAAWSIRATLTPLSGVLSYAARRGVVPRNVVAALERRERPKVTKRPVRVLTTEQIGTLLAKSLPADRVLLATGVFTGLRIGELLGLTWGSIDFAAGFVRVRWQLGRDTTRLVPCKTDRSARDVILMAPLAAVLREHRLSAPAGFSGDDDPVFSARPGRPLQRTGARSALRRSLDAAGLPPMRFHELRHAFASLLIAQGENVRFVADQLGDTTQTMLDVYGHLFDAAKQAESASAALTARFGNLLETAGGSERQSTATADPGNVAFLPGTESAEG